MMLIDQILIGVIVMVAVGTIFGIFKWREQSTKVKIMSEDNKKTIDEMQREIADDNKIIHGRIDARAMKDDLQKHLDGAPEVLERLTHLEDNQQYMKEAIDDLKAGQQDMKKEIHEIALSVTRIERNGNNHK